MLLTIANSIFTSSKMLLLGERSIYMNSCNTENTTFK